MTGRIEQRMIRLSGCAPRGSFFFLGCMILLYIKKKQAKLLLWYRFLWR